MKRAEKGAGVIENISIVLVRPGGPSNIGSCARAMKNHGMRNLVLVEPCEYHVDECYSMACNAGDVIMDADVFPDLETALAGFGFVAGTTRRIGRARRPVLTLDEALPTLLSMAQKNTAAVLFGREDRGLENSELSTCDILFELPSHDLYPSLNLSHAVFLLCHYLYIRSGGKKAPAIEAAPRREVDEMYSHLGDVLAALGYGRTGGGHLPQVIMRNFRKLFGRTALMQREVNMLRGLFTRIIEKCGS